MRRELVAVLSMLVPLAAFGQEAAPEDPPPAFRPHLTFDWDALARYDDITHLHFRPDISRGRFEVRPEVGFAVSERFRIGVRAVADYGTDTNDKNSANFDNYRSRGVSVERYYVEARPGEFVVHAGAFGLPVLASEMLWDHDIQTPGAAVSWQPSESGVTVTGAGFYGPQSQGDHTRIGVGQVVWRSGDPSRLVFEAAGAFWYFVPDDLKLFFASGRPNLIRQNYANFSNTGLLSDYRIGDVMLRLRFPAGKIPVLVSLDGIKNFGVRGSAKEDDESQAFEGNVTIGRVGAPGNWRFFYTFQYVERDAVLGAYNTDDWWFHSWYRGHRVGLAATFLPQTYLQASFIWQKRLDRNFYLNRVLVDFVKLF